MTFDPLPDLDNANVGIPELQIIVGAIKSVAPFFIFKNEKEESYGKN